MLRHLPYPESMSLLKSCDALTKSNCVQDKDGKGEKKGEIKEEAKGEEIETLQVKVISEIYTIINLF